MSIKRKIEVQAFIDKGGSISSHKKEGVTFSHILLRIPYNIMEKVDEKVMEKSWMNRTQWIMEAIDQKLKDVE